MAHSKATGGKLTSAGTRRYLTPLEQQTMIGETIRQQVSTWLAAGRLTERMEPIQTCEMLSGEPLLAIAIMTWLNRNPV